MTAFLLRMPGGIVGDLTRHNGSKIEPQVASATNAPTAYGVPVAINTDGGFRAIQAGDNRESVYGFLTRPYPTTDLTGLNTPYGGGTPPTSTSINGVIQNILVTGYIIVQLNGTAASVKDGTVYVRTANASTGKLIGGVEAAPDQSVTQAYAGTGNGLMTLLAASQTFLLSTPAGVYKAIATSATAFNVVDASGAILGVASTTATFVGDNGLTFRITAGGTAFVANDTFTITVVNNTFALSGRTYFMSAADSTNGNVVELAVNI